MSLYPSLEDLKLSEFVKVCANVCSLKIKIDIVYVLKFFLFCVNTNYTYYYFINNIC